MAKERSKLWAHLVSSHAVIISPEASLKALKDLHDEEHDGPCGIRDHAKALRTYKLGKIGLVLSEAEE